MDVPDNFDVIIIGGSYAGLSAAMSLGRSLRTVLIIDGGKPCNRQTPQSHNFITHDGEKPQLIAQQAKAEVLRYKTVHFVEDFALSGNKIKTGFEIRTGRGKTYTARKLIFATGVKDEMPDIIGFAACWGISAIHCPYCHGYEFRGEKTGIIMANGERAFHMAGLVDNLTSSVTIFTQGKPEFNEEELQKLKNHHIKIIEIPIKALKHNSGYIEKVILEDGTSQDLTAVYAALPFEQHSQIPASLGCKLTETGHIQIDMFQKSDIIGVYACGDNASMLRSLANATATGNICGAMVNHELTNEDF